MTKEENISISVPVEIFNGLNDISIHVNGSPLDVSDGVLKSVDQNHLEKMYSNNHTQKYPILEANLILHLLEASVAFYQAIQNACSSSHWNVHAAILIFSNKTTKLWASNQVDITVVVGKMKGLILLVLLATITGIPENSCWTHPVWLISETDKGFFIIFSN